MAKRGRKPGSTNRTYEYVSAIAPTCPSCGSEKINNVAGAPPIIRELVGVLPDGREYRSIRWQRSVCQCGQHLNVKTYLANCPEKENPKSIIRNRNSSPQ